MEKRKGGYYYPKIDASTANQFEKKRATRFESNVDQRVECYCGLNNLGDGNFNLISTKQYLIRLNKLEGDSVDFEIDVDPNPLEVEISKVLQVLLDQDEAAPHAFRQITDGKKRSLIYSLRNSKSIDKQVNKIHTFLKLNCRSGKL